MRAVLAVVLGLALAWGGIWLLAAEGLKRASESWFAAQTANGRTASHGSLDVTGFPGRFALTLTAVSLADPATGTGWQTPAIRITSPSYMPWHLTATLPGPLAIFTPSEIITLTATGLQADLSLTPIPALPLDAITVEGDKLRATSSQGWQLDANHARLVTAKDPAQPNTHSISLTLKGLTPDPALIAALAGQSDLPPRLDLVQIDAVATLTAALDRHAYQTHPTLTNLSLNDSTLHWGPLALTASGTIKADPQGRAEGRIALRLEHWQQALIAARAMGLIRAELAPTLARALTLLALQSGNPDILDLPLTLQSGYVSLGPIPLGPAPLMP
ncbi:MAG: DUF2125 domain-containing protein [Pseudorhodobacter sp.]|nr:DUF2125 domain-containing protein [Pseudorhodobacter sp.]